MARMTWDATQPTGEPDTQEPLGRAREMALIDAARDDPAALEPLYQVYAPRVYGYCLRRLLDRDRAADATSQVFVRVLGALPRFQPNPRHPGATFRAWLFTIAFNVVTDAHRSHRSDARLDLPGDDRNDPAHGLVDPDPLPEETAVLRDEVRRLHAMLAVLPERQRRIIELRLAGLSGAEIAEALGMSLSAVKSAQFRACSTLRDRFQHDQTGRPS